jgi:hypothetical protein
MCAHFLSLLVVLYMSLASQAAPTDPGELTQEPKFNESQVRCTSLLRVSNLSTLQLQERRFDRVPFHLSLYKIMN